MPYVPLDVILAADFHYQSVLVDDGGKALQPFVEHSDGKAIRYSPQLLEAFLDEVVEEKPVALVLSDDITTNREKVNH